MTDLSIIIVNWNSTAYLLKCVESIYAHTHETAFEIIVVDNASPDADVEIVKQQYPDVMLIESPVNLGFSRANNLGFRRSTGEYVVFLNPDTVLINSAFDLMLRKLRSLPRTGAAGCTLLNDDFSVQTAALQTFPTILNQLLDLDVLRNRFPACRLWNFAPLMAGGSEPSRAEAISGACVMLRREVFAQIGQFSEEYFMYAEDLDLCYKAAKAGFANYYLPEGRIIHFGGRSSNPQKAVLMKWRSILQYIAKHRGTPYQVGFRAAMACSALVRLAVLSVLIAVGGTARRSFVRRALSKWWLILRTMISSNERPRQSGGLVTERAQDR